MEFALCTGITVRSGPVNAMLAPEELAVTVLARHNEIRLRITGSREALFRACQQRTLEVT